MTYVLWVVQVLLALLFLFAGGMKLVMSSADLVASGPLSAPFLRFIGVVEILGAAGLVLPGLFRIRPGLTPLAASGLVLIMIGAVVTTALTLSVAMAIIPAVVGILSAFVAVRRYRLLSLTGS